MTEHRQKIDDDDLFSVLKKYYINNGHTPSHNLLADLVGKTRGAINPRLKRLQERGVIQRSIVGQIALSDLTIDELDAIRKDNDLIAELKEIKPCR
tara:strand:- start:1025 stop:1312 length:288 start_codon:yes stop_codon:yes gene_type:complete